MYNIGTVTTTANSTKLVGTGTKWKENINLVLPMQSLQVQIGSTVYNNSIHSIQSNTELTLNFPLPASQTGAKYVIFTTTMDSISAAANAIVAMNVSNVQFSDVLNRIMTESGVIDVKLPDGTTRKTRTEAERDKLLDGKLNANYPEAIGDLKLTKASEYVGIALIKGSAEKVVIETLGDTSPGAANIIYRDKDNKNVSVVTIPKKTGTTMLVGDYGVGVSSYDASGVGAKNESRFIQYGSTPTAVSEGYPAAGGGIQSSYTPSRRAQLFLGRTPERLYYRFSDVEGVDTTTIWKEVYSTANTTKDSNGNLKAASPVVKLFADHIELNDESEGVEMEHLGVGHYLIKGVVGFNADGAWGINNGFVIPQDHNGKNMVLIDYDVKPDGDIELFVFHQQNTDMPERFQNKRIKDFGEDGQPIYFENYEPCDVPESRWIDMRVEMPPNSIYNLKQAEAERLAKEAAEKQAEEDAKKAELEVEEGGDI
ncbi:cell envelope integrity protein TolA [Providencia manganoxydans]|uniref:cell envelope integrity protein TolA n=1 Tax=Providencia manganoxydans TaxID=2923283 RepID=UPI0034E3E31F